MFQVKTTYILILHCHDIKMLQKVLVIILYLVSESIWVFGAEEITWDFVSGLPKIARKEM
jgi:hypothetical protein